MRPTGYGRPGTRVVPDGWAAEHQPPVEATFTATVSLRRPGTQHSWDEASETTVTTPLPPYWTGPCRVQAMVTQAQNVDAAGEAVTITGYVIPVPVSVVPDEGDLATVTGSGDPALDGATLRVESFTRGDLMFERDLHCVID